MDRAETLTEEGLDFFRNLTKKVSPGRDPSTGQKAKPSRSRKAMGTSFTRPFSGPTKPSVPAATIQPELTNVIARLTESGKPSQAESRDTQVEASPGASQQAVQAAEPVGPAGVDDPLAGRYDVRKITSREMNRLGQELYQAGRIGREEMAMLSFQPELSANYDQVGAEGIQRPDPDRPRDALEEWQAILARQLEFGNSSYFTEKTRSIIRLLESLDRCRRGAA